MQDVLLLPVNSTAVNTTRNPITEAASTAASSAANAVTAATGLLSNATAALTAATNATASNATNATVAAGGMESDTLLGSHMVNASTADGVVHSGVQKVTGVLNGVKSWLNSSKSDEPGELLARAWATSDVWLASHVVPKLHPTVPHKACLTVAMNFTACIALPHCNVCPVPVKHLQVPGCKKVSEGARFCLRTHKLQMPQNCKVQL